MPEQDEPIEIVIDLGRGTKATGIDEKMRGYLDALPTKSWSFTGYFSCDRCGKGHAESEPCPAPCPATACHVCGICSTCEDFHFYGGGCTEDRCPLDAEQPT